MCNKKHVTCDTRTSWRSKSQRTMKKFATNISDDKYCKAYAEKNSMRYSTDSKTFKKNTFISIKPTI